MREFAISCYLIGFNFIFCLAKVFPLKKKLTFVISFPENALFIYEQLKKENPQHHLVFLCHERCYEAFKETGEIVYLVESKKISHTLKGIFHLATSKKIIVDNYYGFLSVITFKKSVECIQIWHAAGAIKQFGIKDPSNDGRTLQAIKRFKKVYEKFDKIVVGSEFMATLYKEAFLANESTFLKIGVPRTDFFFQEKRMEAVRDVLIKENTLLKNKKVILYAPTFRKEEDVVKAIALDLAKMYEALKEEHVLLLKLHPKVKSELHLDEQYPGFVFDYSHYPTVNDLLVITDVLISDYSSIPMEYAFLKRKMIFFAYDLETYQRANGFWETYEKAMPGPVVKTTEAIIHNLLHETTDFEAIQHFLKKWNEYSTGKASHALVAYIEGE